MRTPLINLLSDNRGRGFFKSEKVKMSDGASEDTIFLYDAIVSDDFYGGVSAINFAKTINAMKADTIHLRINSPGGDVFAGVAMQAAIKNHPATVIVHIDGLAASAASVVAMAADKIMMADGAFFMIHNSWTFAVGNADDMLHTADMLEKVDISMSEVYASRTGQSIEDIRKWMGEETWFSANEAIALNFADDLDKYATKASSVWDLCAYSKSPAMHVESSCPDNQPCASDIDREHLSRTVSVKVATLSV